MLSVTVEDVMTWGPCQPDYPEGRVRELFAGRERLTVVEVLDLDIPAADRMWCCLRQELVPDRMLCRFHCRLCREQPVGDGVLWDLLTDERSRAVVETRERWLAGDATDDELRAAEAAAAAAAVAAVAAAEAAWAEAAWAEAREWQVGLLREQLEDHDA